MDGLAPLKSAIVDFSSSARSPRATTTRGSAAGPPETFAGAGPMPSRRPKPPLRKKNTPQPARRATRNGPPRPRGGERGTAPPGPPRPGAGGGGGSPIGGGTLDTKNAPRSGRDADGLDDDLSGRDVPGARGHGLGPSNAAQSAC